MLVTRRNERSLNKAVREIKESTPCFDCKKLYHYSVMQFDHKPEETKVADVRKLMWSSSFDTVMKEIDKCVLRCANCHAYVTWKRQEEVIQGMI